MQWRLELVAKADVRMSVLISAETLAEAEALAAKASEEGVWEYLGLSDDPEIEVLSGKIVKP